MAIEWREDLVTGNDEIDNQHKELFRRFNNLLNACNQGKGNEELRNLLLFLGEYVRSHFAMEERLQVRHNYPGYLAHKEEHESFINDLHSLESRVSSEGATVALVIKTNQIMVNWLIRHISRTDKELAAFLRIAG